MKIEFDALAKAYIAAGAEMLNGVMSPTHVLFIGFPLSRRLQNGENAISGINDGPLVTFGTMEQAEVADCTEFSVGKHRVWMRLRPDLRKYSVAHFSMQNDELIVQFFL